MTRMIGYLTLFLILFTTLAAASSPPSEKPVVYVGTIPRYNPILMYRSYQPMMDYLTENTPYRFELKLARDYPDAVACLRRGETQIALLGDVTFAEARAGFEAVPILKPMNSRGISTYHSIIIVREDSPIKTLQDLKGKKFAFNDPHSTSGNLIPRYFLFENGITLFDLSEYVHMETHDAVAKAVLKGKVDAGAVKDIVAYRYQEQGLRLLAMSGPIPGVPVVVRKDTPPELVAAVKEALLSIDPQDPKQRDLMAGWDPEFRYGFTEAFVEDYEQIYRMMDNVRDGCGIRCH